jgi:Tfp pilus assembly protein PilV
MIINNKQKNNLGFSLVEVVIACSILSITVLSLMLTAGKSIQVSGYSLNQAQATLLAEEGVEAVKSIRDNDWNAVTTNGSYYLFFNTTTNLWSLRLTSSGMSAPNGSIPNYPIDSTFSRTVAISSVNRDSNKDIASTGSLDTGTKKVVVTTSWNNPSGIVNKSISFYISNIFN